MKTLYSYLIKKYVPPFLGTLFISVFIFFMVFVFTYIDEIAGKGIDAWTLAQMFFFTFLMFIPNSMPLAVLLSSIMTFGNLGENYELAALKSSGLSLTKIMRPLLVFIIFLSLFSFYFNNYTMPFIHLKQASLLYDVRGAKPALNIKEGIFYNGIEGYSIRVGSKDVDGKTIRNILIYDHTERKGNVVQMYADSGRLEMNQGKDALIITLYNGTRYEQIVNEARDLRTRPMMTVAFEEQMVRIDLSGFKMKRTDEELFKNNAEMMNLRQLSNYIDTAKYEKKKMAKNVYQNFTSYFNQNAYRLNKKKDSLKSDFISVNDHLKKYDLQARKQIIENALNITRSSSSFLDGKIQEDESNKMEQARYEINWHGKFTLSFACIVLFFVGAPLGAIVRKGGLGMPVVISVFLFIIYHVISFSCQKMALQGKMDSAIGMWIGPLSFLPFGIWLTYKSATDSALFDSVLYIEFFQKLIAKFRKKSNSANIAVK